MEKKNEIYADGIGQIHFVGGMVRFDFVTLQRARRGSRRAISRSESLCRAGFSGRL